MSNEEFDNLKEELMWEGSSVVMLSNDTNMIFQYLHAPFAEYDQLFCVFQVLMNKDSLKLQWLMCLAIQS